MSIFPVILSAASGTGKTTIARELLDRRDDVGYSVSCTTRPRREGEVDGEHYHFLTRDAFEAERDAGGFAEWAEVHGHLYGTLRREVERVLASGRHCLMDIDVQGAQQFVAAFPRTVRVFVLPPSAAALQARLDARGTESPEKLLVRLRNARTELADVSQYEYVVVNDDLEQAIERVGAILDAEASRRDRVAGLDQQVDDLIHQLEQQITGHQRGG